MLIVILNFAIQLHCLFPIFVPQMKILAFILSLSVLMMALMPCTDEVFFEDGTSMSHVETSDHEHNHNHDHSHNHGEEDTCPPLCSCQCCGTSLTMPQLTWFIELDNELLFSFNFHYSFNYVYDINRGIWHPPTLS